MKFIFSIFTNSFCKNIIYANSFNVYVLYFIIYLVKKFGRVKVFRFIQYVTPIVKYVYIIKYFFKKKVVGIEQLLYFLKQKYVYRNFLYSLIGHPLMKVENLGKQFSI